MVIYKGPFYRMEEVIHYLSSGLEHPVARIYLQVRNCSSGSLNGSIAIDGRNYRFCNFPLSEKIEIGKLIILLNGLPSFLIMRDSNCFVTGLAEDAI